MRCPMCRGHVSLRDRDCACGFVLTTGDPTPALDRARRDLRRGWLVVAVGLAGVLATAILMLVIEPTWREYLSLDGIAVRMYWYSLVRGAGPLLAPLVAVLGLARGAWLVWNARLRLGFTRGLLRIPVARVVAR